MTEESIGFLVAGWWFILRVLSSCTRYYIWKDNSTKLCYDYSTEFI